MTHPLARRAAEALRAAARGDLVLYRHRAADSESAVRAAGLSPFGALAVALLLSILLPSRVWPVLAVTLAVLIAICLGWAVAGARRVMLTRQLRYTWVQVGDRLEEIFTLYNALPVPIVCAEIADHSNLPGYDASTVRSVGGQSLEKWHQKAISQQRGVFHLGPTTLRFGDPLGLFEVTCEYSYSREVLVFPPILHDLSVPVPAGGGQGAAASRLRHLAETPALSSVRDYHPGDPIRRIHWPLSLRHQTLLIKEFDDEKGGDVWLALDLDPAVHAGQGPLSTAEYAIVWTASWAWHLLRQGKGVGLYTRGPEPIVVQPRTGTAHLWAILRALAPLDARAGLPLAGLLQEVRPLVARGHSLIIVTPSCSPDWPAALLMPRLRSAARGVVLLDADAFRQASGGADAASTTSGLAGVRSLLAGLGLPVTLVRPGDGLGARPAAAGTGDFEYVTTPWGRVIVRAAPAEVHP